MTPVKQVRTLVRQGVDSDGFTYPGKADFISEIVEAANAVLSVLVVVILDEAEAATVLARSITSVRAQRTLCTIQC